MWNIHQNVNRIDLLCQGLTEYDIWSNLFISYSHITVVEIVKMMQKAQSVVKFSPKLNKIIFM